MKKIAVDDAAKKYWKLLYGDFGEALTRDIPRRIKTALLDNKKVASVDDTASVLPVAHAMVGTELHLEGLYRDKGTKLMFHAELSKDGTIKDIKFFDLR